MKRIIVDNYSAKYQSDFQKINLNVYALFHLTFYQSHHYPSHLYYPSYYVHPVYIRCWFDGICKLGAGCESESPIMDLGLRYRSNPGHQRDWRSGIWVYVADVWWADMYSLKAT